LIPWPATAAKHNLFNMILDYQLRKHQLRHPFAISRYTYQNQPAVIVRLSKDGQIGYGEATFNPYYNIDQDNIVHALERTKPFLMAMDRFHPDELWTELKSIIPDHPFALCALNNASWDLFAKINGMSVRDMLNLHHRTAPLTSVTIGLTDKFAAVQRIRESPWPVYKIKLGGDHDMELMRAIRRVTDATLRIDANEGWDAENTLKHSELLKVLGVEFVEQPLPASDEMGLRKIAGKTALPIVADESCREEADVEKCQGIFDGINIKLQKCGGLTPALRMIRKGRSLGMKIMIGCMTESSIGIAAAAQLISLVDYVDLDGPLLISNDTASGVEYKNGKLVLSGGPGFGLDVLL
jgi:L-alanine-DL-glutamate epimerase-like enolase superfamily enzyme